MGTRKVEIGLTGQAVARNLRRLRTQQELSLQDLSDRLAQVGRPILATGLSKIEQGTRRVDVDDLVALAASLVTDPNNLLGGPEVRGGPLGLTQWQQEAAVWAASQVLRQTLGSEPFVHVHQPPAVPVGEQADE